MFEVFCGRYVHSFRCYWLDKDDKDTEHIWQKNMGLKLDGSPQIILLKEKPDLAPPTKYLLTTFDSEEDIHTFYKKSLEGEWPPHYRSQNLPSPNFKSNQVKASSRNILEILKHDAEEDVLLYLYSETCGYCKDFNPVWESAADQLKKKYPSVKIRLAKMDGQYNDVPDYSARGFPAFLLYTKDSGSNYIEVDLPRDLPGFMQWMKNALPSWRDADVSDL